jgi:8-oxo-dGTP pyrophosphatase MutT (NUDIX family)
VKTWAIVPAKQSSTVIIRDGDKYLFVLRDDKDWIWSPGTWSLVGGQAEKGETADIAARREIGEELGIFPTQCLIPIGAIIETGGIANVMLYIATHNEFDNIALAEGQCFEWLTIEDITNEIYKGRSFVPAQIEMINLCR